MMTTFKCSKDKLSVRELKPLTGSEKLKSFLSLTVKKESNGHNGKKKNNC